MLYSSVTASSILSLSYELSISSTLYDEFNLKYGKATEFLLIFVFPFSGLGEFEFEVVVKLEFKLVFVKVGIFNEFAFIILRLVL